MDIPRIVSVAVLAADTLEPVLVRPIDIVWVGDDAGASTIELAGWIGTGGDALKPLHDPVVFTRAEVGRHGASVTWDGGEGDLSIDALHLHRLWLEQRPFRKDAISAWQAALALSNTESAALLGVQPSTWATYKNGAARVPTAIAIACRSMLADPVMLQAHLRPTRGVGRPRRNTGA